MLLIVSPLVSCHCRRGTSKGTDRAVALPGGHFPECHNCDRLRDALPPNIVAGGVSVGEAGPTDHLAEL